MEEDKTMEIKKELLDISAEEVKQNIKKHIASLRRANGLSMHDVASALNMNENTYRIWEDPKRSCPRPSDIVKISMLYGVSIDFLMSGYETVQEQKKVASPDTYNDDEEPDVYLSSLDKYEKLLLLKIRLLDYDQKEELAKYVHELLYNNENKK